MNNNKAQSFSSPSSALRPSALRLVTSFFSLQSSAAQTGRESGILADSRCPLLSAKCSRLLCSSISIFPRVAALTFSTEKLTVFRDSRGSAVLLCPVKKRCHRRKVMSAPSGCLLNLRRHYFTTQHDCIHIIPHPAKGAGTPLAWRPCARGPWGAGFNQQDRDPSAFSVDGQSNKAGSSMTHQSARVRAGGEWQRLRSRPAR